MTDNRNHQSAKRRHALARRSANSSPAQPLHNPPQHLSRDPCFTGNDSFQCRAKIPVQCIGRKVASCAVCQRAKHTIVLTFRRFQKYHRRLGSGSTQRGNRIVRTLDNQVQVQNEHPGSMLQNKRQNIATPKRLRHNFQVRRLFEQLCTFGLTGPICISDRDTNPAHTHASFYGLAQLTAQAIVLQLQPRYARELRSALAPAQPTYTGSAFSDIFCRWKRMEARGIEASMRCRRRCNCLA